MTTVENVLCRNIECHEEGLLIASRELKNIYWKLAVCFACGQNIVHVKHLRCQLIAYPSLKS